MRQHLVGEEPHIVDRFRDAHAALLARRGLLEVALSAPSGMNLRFHDRDGTAQFLRDRNGLLWRKGCVSARNGNAVISEDRFGLIFMHIHGTALIVREEAKIGIGKKEAAENGGSEPYADGC